METVGVMKELLTTVTRKGQITVPVEIRKVLRLKQGDKVALSLADAATGEVRLRPVQSVAEATFGAVRPKRRPENLDALRRAFEANAGREAAAETDIRET
jgi:AbrB family looped-hinge helix DNA binding protein